MTWLYDLSFTFFVVITGAAVLASSVSLVLPALFSTASDSDPTVNWNVIAIIGSYVALSFVSLGIYISRKITTNQKLRGIPKRVVANKEGDIPSPAAELIAIEYDRACAVIHISQPVVEVALGWGMPGTEYEGVQFRRAILESLTTLDTAARALIPTFPPMKPHQSAEVHLKPLEGILTRHDRTCLATYSGFVQLARYAEREPTEEEFQSCMRVHAHMSQILKLLRSGPAQTRPS